MAPAIIPKIGFLNTVSMFVNSGTSARGLTAALMAPIPVISIAKPISIEPTTFFFSLFVNIKNIMPIKANIGEKDSGFKSCIIKLSPSTPVKLKIHDVTVVPILAPIIM